MTPANADKIDDLEAAVARVQRLSRERGTGDEAVARAALELLPALLARARAAEAANDGGAPATRSDGGPAGRGARRGSLESMAAPPGSAYARLLLDNAPEAFVLTNALGVVLYANRAAAALFTRRQAFLVGKPLPILMAAGDRPAVRAAINLLRRDASHPPFDVRVGGLDSPGAIVRATAGASAHGGIRMLYWALRDVTLERQQAVELRLLTDELERLVTERTAELETALDQLPVGVGIVDRRSGKLVRANPALGVILGRAPGDTLSGLRLRRAQGERVPRELLPDARAAGGERVHEEIYQMPVGSKGALRWLEVSGAPVHDSLGRVTSAVLVFADVTTRHTREIAMRMFSANASHELATPIAGILGSVEALQAGAKDDPVERERFFANLHDQALRLQGLTRSLLALARAQAGIERPDVAVVRLSPLLEEAARAVVPGPGVELVVACDEAVAALTNEALLRQALGALLSNAVRYTEHGRISVTAGLRNRRTEIVVEDTGPGLPEDVLVRMLEGFWHGPTTAGHGFGLGLPLARDSARAAGGELRLEDAPGGGTRAVIALHTARMVDEA